MISFLLTLVKRDTRLEQEMKRAWTLCSFELHHPSSVLTSNESEQRGQRGLKIEFSKKKKKKYIN